MIKTFPCVVVNELGETTFIAGTFRELYFHIFTSASAVVDMGGQLVTWVLSPYDQPDYISLSKTASCYNGYFYIPLLSTDTLHLFGKYLQKSTIVGVDGYSYKVGQGILNILPAGGV